MQKPQKESVISAAARQNLYLHYPREFHLSILPSVNFIAGSVNPRTFVPCSAGRAGPLPPFCKEADAFSLYRIVTSFQGWW